MATASHAADWNYGTDRVGNASMGTGTEGRDSERYGLVSSTGGLADSGPIFPLVNDSMVDCADLRFGLFNQ